MSRVSIAGLGKAFGGGPVLDGVDLDIANAEVMAVLGPSGCGKTTMLRIIAGFLDPDAGTVAFDGTPVAEGRLGGAGRGVSVPPQRRGVGYVPQEGALFPHLDVRGNVLFGLPRRERSPERLAELLDLVELPASLATAYAHQLSGGQQQRVALARALAPRPRVVLLDEPFSSLDASLRVTAGREVSRVLRTTGTTTVLVTHDQGEALSLADRVAVMRAGRIAQVDDPVRLYRSPVDLDVASFVGGAARLPATLHGTRARCLLGEVSVAPASMPAGLRASTADGTAPPAQRVSVLVRPEQIRLVPAEASEAVAVVEEIDFYGPYAVARLLLEGGERLVARVSTAGIPRTGTRVGVEVVGDVGVYP